MSLVEVLVALAILALAGVGLAAAHGNLLLAREAARRLDNEDEALRRAREAVLAADALGEGKTVGKTGEHITGRVELADGRFAEWTAEIAAAEAGDLFRVRLSARADGAAAETIQEFHLLRPDWSVEADRRALLDAARERLRLSRGFEGTMGGEATGGTSRGKGGKGNGQGGQGGRGGEGGQGRPRDGQGGEGRPRGGQGPEGGPREGGPQGRPQGGEGQGRGQAPGQGQGQGPAQRGGGQGGLGGQGGGRGR